MNGRHTPWDFTVGSPQFTAPGHNQCLHYQYASLSEIGMGGPLRGPCFWGEPDSEEVLVHENCGGPPVWQKQGDYFAIPIWKSSWLYGWTARLGIVALSSRKLILFRKSFRVLQLEDFGGYLVTGIDSPIYYPKALRFDMSMAAIERIIPL